MDSMPLSRKVNYCSLLAKLSMAFILVILAVTILPLSKASAAENLGCSSSLNGNVPESRYFSCSSQGSYQVKISMKCIDVYSQSPNNGITQTRYLAPGETATIQCPDNFPYSGDVTYKKV